jgi:hypothetical protein
MVGRWSRSGARSCLALVAVVAAASRSVSGATLSSAPSAPPGKVVGARGSSEARGGALPDSLLARVGSHREISVSSFRRAWNQVAPPSRPDSLTPESARQFLDLLIGKELLADAALAERWTWTASETAQLTATADRMVMGWELDSALVATRRERLALGDTIRSTEVLGTVARDSLVARLGATFDDSLAARLARIWDAIPKPSKDSSLTSQLHTLAILPRVPPADTARVLARTREGDLRVSEVVGAWARISPISRPRVSSAAQIEDLARNAIFERHLRRDAERRGLAKRPEIAATLARLREYFAVSHYVGREVYATLNADSLTLQRYFAAHRAEYVLPQRVRVIQLVLPTRADATRLALQLRDAAQAESLAVRGERRGARYRTEVAEETDAALFHRAVAAGFGTVLGPDSTSAGWSVSRVGEVLPARPREFHEVRDLVEHAWYGDEGEARMQALIARVRRGARVAVNARAVAALTR